MIEGNLNYDIYIDSDFFVLWIAASLRSSQIHNGIFRRYPLIPSHKNRTKTLIRNCEKIARFLWKSTF